MGVGAAGRSAHAHTSAGLHPKATRTSSSREEGLDPGCSEAWAGSRKTKLQPNPVRVCREQALRKRGSPARRRQRLGAHAVDGGARAPRLGL